jgi:hypothetical protein
MAATAHASGNDLKMSGTRQACATPVRPAQPGKALKIQ